jgi:hypothetical protein
MRLAAGLFWFLSGAFAIGGTSRPSQKNPPARRAKTALRAGQFAIYGFTVASLADPALPALLLRW